MNERETIKVIVRNVGRLLEESPTTGTDARRVDGSRCRSDDPESASFCILGGIYRECDKAKVEYTGTIETAVEQYLNVTNPTALIDVWEGEGTTDDTRLTIARKLQQYE